MVAVGFDTETHLIEPGLLAPPIVCASSSTADGADRLFHAHRDKMPHGCIGAPIEHTSAREHFEWLLYQDPIFGSNIAYDIAVCMAKWPELANKIYDAYDDDRIVDVGLCQQLIENADGGMLTGSEGAAYQSLTSLERLYLNKDREAQKYGPDVWRLRYKELEPVELHRWPRAAVVYPLDDARGPLQIGLKQLEKHAGLIKNAPAQSRAAFQLQLIMCWGVMVDPRMVRRLEEEARELYDKLTLLLVDQGLVRGQKDKKPGTRDLRAAQRRMLLWYRMHNLPMKLTDKGIEKLMKLRVDKKTPVPDPKTVFSESELVQFLAVDEDACKETGDPVLIAYARRVQVHTILHTHVPDLLKGVRKPIQPKYWTMVASGRTSCSKGKKKGGDNKSQNGFQFQNPKRALDYFPPHVGIRECFIARPRRLFADPDFGQLELHTGAQACIATVGYSRLGEALNAGRDAHLQFGAKLMKISYEEAKARKHEKIVKFHRQLAKIWNFGKPGGLGVRGMVGYARGYGVRLTVEDCKKYDREWIEEFNEWEDYFSFIRKHIDITTGEGVIEQLYVSRIRGGVTFTSGSNCLDDETEALTDKGWVRGFDLKPGVKLLTKNADTGELEWQPATRVEKYPNYKGPLVEFKTKNFSAVTTPNHRWLVTSKKGKIVCKTTKEIGKNGDFRIHRSGDYAGAVKSKYSDDFVELSGWLLTDGNIHNRRISIHQSQRANPREVRRIDAMFSRLKIKPYRYTKKDGSEGVNWRFGLRNNRKLVEQLLDLFPDRVLSIKFLLDLTKKQLELLWTVMMLGDGTCKKKPTLRRHRTHQQMFSARSEEVGRVFQVLCTLVGLASELVWRDMSMYRPTSAKLRNTPKGKGVWLVKVLKRDTVQVVNLPKKYGISKTQTQQRREYTGAARIWCPVVANTYFVARRRGTVYVTGNTLFQGLAADGAKHALYEVGKRCYVPEKKSILYGARPLGFIHDEILGEVFDEEDYAHYQATEMASVMVEACNKFLPDVPVRCAPSLCKRWSKDVEPIYDRSGYLLPYDLARERKQEAFYDAKATERVNWVKMEEEAIEKWHKAIGWEEQKAV